uniref:tyrosine-type recombinase/integrase n=1 Tax=Enterocloster clostridioformis TaxID=1531 RepID=UPI002FE6F25A
MSRNRARLGLRIGDIRELKLSDIDWQACTLTIIQNKAKEPLTLPVPDDVGWAVIDYLKNGRPVTESKNVFVRHIPPYNSFAITSNQHNIMTKALSDAGITYRGKPSGFHTLRHSPASWQHIFTVLWRNGTGWVSSLEKKNGSCMNWTG